MSNPRGLGLLIKEAKGWRDLGKGPSPSPLGRPAKEGREESLPFPNSDWGEELDSSLQTCLSQQGRGRKPSPTPTRVGGRSWTPPPTRLLPCGARPWPLPLPPGRGVPPPQLGLGPSLTYHVGAAALWALWAHLAAPFYWAPTKSFIDIFPIY